MRDFTGDGVNVIDNEDGVMIDGSINVSKSKHDQPRNQIFHWLMAGFSPLANGQTCPLPSPIFSTIRTRHQPPSGFLSFTRFDGAFLDLVFIIH